MIFVVSPDERDQNWKAYWQMPNPCWNESNKRTRNSDRPYVSLIQLYILTQKKETPGLHLCMLVPNKCIDFIQLFCFSNVDHLAMLHVRTKQKSIRWSLAPITTPQHQYPNFESHKLNILCPLFSLIVAVHPCLTERTHCWVVMSVRCIPCCRDRWHKSVM